MPLRYPQDRELYPNEIARTDQTDYLLDRDGPGPSVCRYCRNTDTQQIFGHAAKPFADYYGRTRFKAYSCFCCGAVWSYALPTRIEAADRLHCFYPFHVVVAYQITAIKSPTRYQQWSFDTYHDFYPEAIAAHNAASIARGNARHAQTLKTLSDERAVTRYLWWGHTQDPWFQARQGKQPTKSPLSYEMNPERIQCCSSGRTPITVEVIEAA